jgi:aminopeptidase YwaD
MKSFLLALALFIINVSFAQTDKELTDKTQNKNLSFAHLSFLASDELKGRDTPSEGQEIAAKYIATQFAQYGVQPFEKHPDYRQRVSFMKIVAPTSGAIAVGGQTFSYESDFLKMSGENLNWSGGVVRLKFATAEEIASSDVTGKIIVASCGDGQEQSPQAWFSMSSAKREAAQAAGAIGLIELYNSPQIPWQLLVRYLSGDRVALDKGEKSLASFWLLDEGRKATTAFDGAKTMEIKVDGIASASFTAPNVVGFVEGTDPKLKNEYVVYCAHFDHVGIGKPDAKGDSIYNGTRDNAIGTVAVLEAARNIAKYPTKRSALFVLFTGEEKGLLGSEWFVDNAPVALKDIVFCNNIDNGGYNDTSKITVIGLERTTAQENMVAAGKAYGLEVISDPAPEQGLFDRSDNVRFAAKGIPAPDFSMGFNSFDEEIMKYYHQAGDHVESVDMEYVYKYWSAYILAGRLISNAKEKPFWVMGDKYYDAGVKLYGK